MYIVTHRRIVDDGSFYGEEIATSLSQYDISSRKGTLSADGDHPKRIDETCIFDSNTGESKVVGLYDSHIDVVATIQFVIDTVRK